MHPELKAVEVKTIQEAFAGAFLIRSFEERLLRLFSEGKLFGTVHTCIGQEFSGIAVACHLLPGDLIFSNHRCHGHYLARTGDVEGLMAEIMGRATGICGGRGGSQHICGGGVFSNGVQGGIVPVAAGLAMAQQLTGSKRIVVAFIGDGTLGEGAVYETLNILSKWRLPMAVVLENNGYSQSTASAQTLAGGILERARSFGLETWHGNTWAPADLIATAGEAIRQVRERSLPGFVLIDTYRLAAHSKGDDDRPAAEVRRYWSIDPLNEFSAKFPEEAAGLAAMAESRISQAVDAASEAPLAQLPPQPSSAAEPPLWKRTVIHDGDLVVRRIHQAVRDWMADDDRVVLLGEDIEAPYGGAFKVTRDLSLAHPLRVRNTPLSEAALIGIGSGLAMAGMRPLCEIMFGDFLTLAADQIINHAAKFRWVYNGQVSVPLIIRAPMGGRRGYGPTHSQTLEKHFLGLPDTWVLAVHHRYDPYALYRSLFETIDRPALMIENKALYAERVSDRTIDGFWCEDTGGSFPTTRIRSAANSEVTIVCYGGMLPEAEKALDRLFEEHEIVGEIVCPTQLYPLALEPVLESVQATGRMLVVEEGQLFCGFGSEVIAAVHEQSPGLPPVMRRLGPAAHPLPSSKPAELDSLPGADDMVRACVGLVRHV
jgi:2-oxoisovalerate dehydrogenase E1 component